ncbi:type I restriction enzyme HsdR N-terminal domain-containing protein [Bradyrhizobium genomosp. I (2014)]|uniref:type I restriction enzyme HsdR N-terminal domain-containing protein n=1 Tax=Bradyrhizobium genomosp. I (2014) TaxID=2683269 RepID=UPI0004AD94F2|nr:type I restriction enzyme HsdR N-terminal domain-containing protein [Bradyrhizobium sp. CCBAU 43298]
MSDFWSVTPADFTNEADVELRLVVPLLHALGYEPDDIASKYPVEFREGRVGRKPEADFVCFNGPLHTRDTSLVVVEAKAPGEALPNGKLQGESYAANLRAPLLLLTNGEQMEIWQLKATQDSERVFEVPIADLAASRGTVEQFLAKTAVADYCRSFHVKTILDASSDFGRYETAELKRTSRYAASIDRTVYRAGATGNSATGRLLAECPSGCVVVAPSGYGKTTLSNRLFRQAIENRWRNGNARVPFDIPAIDLEQTGLSIVKFMQRRLSAHQPGVTESVLTDRLRTAGATIVCDGFESASPGFQRHLSTEITNLLRDYPLTQVFVFSREAARPNVALPLFTLSPLTETERRELEKTILDDGSGNFFSIIGMMPPTLSALCENPLLLQLALDYWKREHVFPNQLVPLFQSWLKNVLKTDGTDVVSFIRRERALTLIANATLDGPITGDRVIALMQKDGVPAEALNELVACDAARVNGSAIEVQHEALADYLRAKTMASGIEPELLTRIPALPMPADSFFPVLLMAQLPTRRLQTVLWKRLTEAGPYVYFDALRYRFDVSSELNKLNPEKLSEEYLTELLEGIEQPLESFFPALRQTVIEEITGERGSDLAATGNLRASSKALSYKLHSRQPSQAPPVKVEVPSFPGILRGVSLDLSHYRLDSARLVAIALLKESVADAVKFVAFKGGTALAQDRLLGRCRFLAREYDLPVVLDMDLGALERLLLPHKDKSVSPGAFSDDQRFLIQELLDDIAILRANGLSALDPWWIRLGWDDKVDVQTEEVIRRVLDEQYRRVQIIYAEIVETTFSEIAREMSFFPLLPVRWKLTVVQREPPYRGSTIYFSWSPVAMWQQAGADVVFDVQAPSFEGEEQVREEVERTRAALAALGRPNAQLPRYSGFTQLADFSGRRWNGHFDGATPAIHDVCSLLKSDLEAVFSSMPRHD